MFCLQLREYTEQEEELARVEAEITILTQDNADYKGRLHDIEEKLRMKKIEISNLEIEIKKFEQDRRVSRESSNLVLYKCIVFTIEQEFLCQRI